MQKSKHVLRVLVLAICSLLAWVHHPLPANAYEQVNICNATHCAYLPATSKSDLISISNVAIGVSGKFTASVQGKLFNADDKPIFNTKIELRITDLDRQTVITREVTTGLTGTLPGQANPFRTTLSAFPGLPRVSIEARIKEYSTTYTPALANLEVVSYTADLFDCIGSCLGGVTVQVRNPYEFGVSNVRLLVWTSDSFCSSVTSVPVTTTLAAGASFQYQWGFCGYQEMMLYPTSDLYIVAQGEVAP
jgi:hypothetical protein